MKVIFGGLIALVGGVAFFLSFSPKTVVLQNPQPGALAQTINLPAVPEAPLPSSSPVKIPNTNGDIPNQPQLKNPPEVIKAVYVTAWSAGSYAKMTSIINLIKSRGLNAVVIDIKDYSGYVSYAMDVPEVKASGAEEQIRIAKPNELIKRLHDENIYVIGRITVFQDPILAKAHPEWALHNASSGAVWLDNNKLAWMDPDGQPTWDYVVSIAKDALSRGFDEINFDYIRFASDGNLGAISFPFWDGKTPKHLVIKKFFGYLREQMPDAKLSADLFGLSTFDSWDDLGIGQVIEDAYQYFDYVCPMVYPSHYASGTLGYKNPADHPYEIIKYSMDKALKRLMANSKEQMANSSSTSSSSAPLAISNPPFRAKLRPWLQVFDLGAVYTPEMIQQEIQATDDSLASSTKGYGGWLLWDPANNYTNFK
ncbi:MAG TPA: putative glycoside hydrolase [Candidatus Paceibacterota bacterium]|nr:putative glycoside hydrolase [Candidatus Paceibacterota bacterium]